MTNEFCKRASMPAWAFSGNRRVILTGFVSVSATLFISQAGAFPFRGSKGQTKGANFVEHTDLNPDRMWPVYRRYHLIIVGQRDDEKGLTLSKASTDTLAQFLPESRALLVRAADTRRIGVLIATDQQDVAVMSSEGAKALFLGEPPFEDITGGPVRAIVSFGTHQMVCRPNFRARHAYAIAKTLSEHQDSLAATVAASQDVVPMHPGARAFFAGEDIPDD
jgi:hypothetical protein